MKKILVSLMVLAFVATPLTIARPHYNSTGTAGSATTADGAARVKNAKNYQNLKGNYKTSPSTTDGTTAGSANRATLPAANNLKSNFGGSNADGTTGTAAGSSAPKRR